MSRRTPFGALLVALLLVAAAPAAAKGPTRLEIQDPQSGETTVLDDSRNQFHELMEVVGWPAGRTAPPGVDSGALEHVATLTWTLDDKTPLWIDRVYADKSGETWVQRRDFHGANGSATWGQARNGDELAALLAAGEEPVTSSVPAPVAATPVEKSGAEASAPDDGGVPLWGIALLALPVLVLALVVGWRRRLSGQPVSDR